MVVGSSVQLCLQLLECAAQNGCSEAAGSLASLLEQGVYDDVDLAKAAKMYEHYASLELGTDEEESAATGGEMPCEDEDTENPSEETAVDAQCLSGVARPTAWGNCFGWENHGLTPPAALAAAARIHESGGEGLKRSKTKAVELYRWASESAMEAGNMKSAMKYEARADELEGEEEEESDDDFGEEEPTDLPSRAPSFKKSDNETAVQDLVDVKMGALVSNRLEQLGKEIGADDVGSIVEHLLNSYQQLKASNANNPGRRGSSGTGGMTSESGLKSCLKKQQFASPMVDQIVWPDESDEKLADGDMAIEKASTMTSDGRSKHPSAVQSAAKPRVESSGEAGAVVRVIDESGKPVEGASVRLFCETSGWNDVKTDKNGRAHVLHAEHVALKVEKSGYKCEKVIKCGTSLPRCPCPRGNDEQ